MAPVDSRTEFERLQVLHETGLLDGPPPSEFAILCEEARSRFGVAVAMVTLVGRDELVLLTQGATVPRSEAFCEWSIRANEVFVVPDLSRDPRFADNAMVAGPPHHRFYAGAPLVYLDGIRLGAVCLLDSRPRDFSAGDRAELAAFADEVVTIIAHREFVPPACLSVR